MVGEGKLGTGCARAIFPGESVRDSIRALGTNLVFFRDDRLDNGFIPFFFFFARRLGRLLLLVSTCF